MSQTPLAIPVDASPTDQQAWVLLAKALAENRLVNEAVSLAQLRHLPTPSTPEHYLAVLQTYRDTGGFPQPFTADEEQCLDDLIAQLEDLGVVANLPTVP